MRLLPSSVPGDLAVCVEIDPRSRRVSWTPELEPVLGLVDARGIFARHMGDLPSFGSYRRGEGWASKVSDFMTQRQFHRTAIYNEFYRRMGLEYQGAAGATGTGDGGLHAALAPRLLEARSPAPQSAASPT